MIKVPEHLVVRRALVESVTEDPGVPSGYVVKMLFDGVSETFHVHFGERGSSGGSAGAFNVREHSFFEYHARCGPFRSILRLVDQIHRGERREFPIDMEGLASEFRR